MGRVCNKCGEVFFPTGTFGKLCDDCKIIGENLKEARRFTTNHLVLANHTIDKIIEQGAPISS